MARKSTPTALYVMDPSSDFCWFLVVFLWFFVYFFAQKWDGKEILQIHNWNLDMSEILEQSIR